MLDIVSIGGTTRTGYDPPLILIWMVPVQIAEEVLEIYYIILKDAEEILCGHAPYYWERSST